MAESLTLFCDTQFPAAAHATLVAGVARHRFVLAAEPITSNLRASTADPAMAEADVVLGQPDPAALLDAPRLRWVQLTSAGYGRYDTSALRDAARARGFALCTASRVYADPCAEHALAFMLAGARQLPECFVDGQAQRWRAAERRAGSSLLRGQSVLLLGWGAIAQRLAALLAPFEVRLTVFRRRAEAVARSSPVRAVATSEALDAAPARAVRVVATSEALDAALGQAGRVVTTSEALDAALGQAVRVVTTSEELDAALGQAVRVVTTSEELDAALGEADHVVDLLPENAQTLRLVDAGRFGRMKPGARFYNVGRGSTVDQDALRLALERGTLGRAFLDVTHPEPLPADHPLWRAPRCVVTPHSAGGRNTEHLALVEHFLANLERFERGEPFVDRVM